jgi:hypothetical protein
LSSLYNKFVIHTLNRSENKNRSGIM